MGDLRSQLLEIREKRNGHLTPRILLEEARPRTHPLHKKVFDLPLREAAEQHYLANCRRLLQVTFRESIDDRPADIRAFVVIRGTDKYPKREYVPIEEVAMDPDAERVMMADFLRRWKRMKGQYLVHAKFLEVFREMIRNDPDIFPVNPDEEYGPDNGTEG